MPEAARKDAAPLPDEVALKAKAEQKKADEAEEARKAGKPAEEPEAEPEEAEEAAEGEEAKGEEQEEPEQEAGESEESEEEKPRRRRRRSRRDRALAELRRENEEIRRQLEEMRQSRRPAEPREQDFPDYSDYLRARDEFSREQGRREASAEAEKQREAAERQRAQTAMQERARKFTEDGQAKYGDFFQVALNSDNFDPSPEVAQVILDSDRAVDVAYYIGKHPDVAERLEAMTPTQAAREIGRIEARLDQPTPKKPPAAPNPVKPVGSGNEPRRPNPETISTDEYIKRRRAGKL